MTLSILTLGFCSATFYLSIRNGQPMIAAMCALNIVLAIWLIVRELRAGRDETR